MFQDATAFDRNIGGWDVSSVTNMSNMFRRTVNATDMIFNNGGSPDINNWDTSSVTNMSIMFGGSNRSILFNQPIGNWDVSSVTNMGQMFQVASAFNQNIGAWDVSSVTDMSIMFSNVSVFNNGGSPDIGNWDVSSVTNMSFMFGGAPAFNQPLANWERVGSTVGNVTAMNSMFGAVANAPMTFNQPIGNWDVSSVTTMALMFSGNANSPHAFNQDISNWNVSSVTDMSSMFQSNASFNQPLANWERTGSTVGNVTNMASMFQVASAFNQNIGNWDVSSVTNMSRMFQSANSFNQNIGNWDVSKASVVIMFMDATAFNNGGSPDIGNWNVSGSASLDFMFGGPSGPAINFNQNIGGWDLRKDGTSMASFSIPGMSEENYSRTLIGWANYVAATDGPYSVPLAVASTRLYNANNYEPGERFTNAVAARAFLVGGRVVEVTGASDTDANTTYNYNVATQTYDASNDWFFAVLGSSWALYDDTDTLQATGTGGNIGTGPHTVVSWDGVLSAATVLRTGASWTITGDAAA
jgi:surface protein